MTDFASLAIEIDASQAGGAARELDNLTTAGTRAERAANNLHPTLARVGTSAGQQRAAMQQLSYQIGDVSTQFSMGVNPMMIFAQQGGQVVQALSLMKGEASGFIGFLAGPWGAVIMGAVSVLGVFGSAMLSSGNDAKKAANDWREARGEAEQLINAMKNLAGLRKANTSADVAHAQNRINDLTSEEMTLTSRYNRSLRGAPNDIDARRSRDVLKDRIYAIRQEKQELQGLVSLGNEEVARQDKVASASSRATSTRSRATGAARAYHEAISDEQRALDAANKSTETYISGLVDQIAKFGRTEKDLRLMGVAKALDVSITDKQKESIKALSVELERLYDARENAKKAGEARDNSVASMIGLGKDFGKTAIDNAKEAEKAQEAYNQSLRDTARLIYDIGGAGKVVGAILGAMAGDMGGVPPAWQKVLHDLGQIKVGKDKQGNDITLADKIKAIFDGVDSPFGKTLKALSSGAGTGLAVGTVLFGSSNKGAQVGGALGGAAGMAIGGPIGAIIGSVLGSVVGSLFSGAKKGSASVTNNGITKGLGNTGESIAATNQAGGAIQSALAKIADQLGGSVGGYGFTIGMRNDEYRVSGNAGADVVGKSPKGLLYRGKDAQEAARVAILNAIQDGAIQGIREGAQNLLKAGGDLDTALAKALKFQSVFDDLKQSTDPMGYAMEKLTKDFDGLRKIFDEAGASAQDYADLEKLLGIKRQESIDNARKAVLDNLRDPMTMQLQILELMGQKEDALAGSRLMELAGMKATLQPLEEMIYQLTDAQDIIGKFAPLADSLRKFRTELLGGKTSNSFGVVAALFRSTAALAAGGDATAMGNLSGTATSFLDAAKQNARSKLEYDRAVGEVLASVDKSIFAADTQVEYAQMQIDAIKNTNDILAQMRAEFAQLQSQVVVNSAQTLQLWKRFEGQGLTVITTQDQPLQVEVVTP